MRAQAIVVCTFLFISTISAGEATYQILHGFNGTGDAGYVHAPVIFDQHGNLYGVAAYSDTNGGTVFKLSPSQGRWNFNVVHEFDRFDPDAANPLGGLVMDEAGNIYGTGSFTHDADTNCGSVFELPASAPFTTLTILHDFGGPEGCDPEATLTYSNGVLWGTTKGGGSAGQGTVFSVDKSGSDYRFVSFTEKKGNQPSGAFNLWGYGTTSFGGEKGQGNIYRLDPVKGLVNQHSFTVEGKAGYAPMGDLLTLDVGGVRTMYGTTSAGGVGGGGTIYRLREIRPNSNRWAMRVLHSFTSGSEEGWAPMAGLVADAAGNLYGTTFQNPADCGTVFKLSPRGKHGHKWTYTLLNTFDLTFDDSCQPTSSLVLDQAGNLYGTTTGGPVWPPRGTVYEITP
jgi:uncharacterized repeat protein (TIGR03803 family)